MLGCVRDLCVKDKVHWEVGYVYMCRGVHVKWLFLYTASHKMYTICLEYIDITENNVPFTSLIYYSQYSSLNGSAFTEENLHTFIYNVDVLLSTTVIMKVCSLA